MYALLGLRVGPLPDLTEGCGDAVNAVDGM